MALSHIRTGTDTCSWYAERDEKFRDPTVCMYTMHYEFTPIFVYEYTMYYANCLRPDCISNGHTGIREKGTTAKGRQKDDSMVVPGRRYQVTLVLLAGNGILVNTPLPGYINNHTSCQIWLFSGRN